MLGREVRLPEKDHYERVGMTRAEPGYLVGGVAVARSDLAQIFAGHAIETVDGGAVVAGGGKQLVKWSPIVAPVEVEPDALAQLVFVNLAASPFVENVVVGRKNGFDSQHYMALAEFGIAEERCQIALRVGQGMVVADQNDSGFGDFATHIARGENFLVGAVGLAKVAKILAPAGRIDGANLTLDGGDGGELGGTAPPPAPVDPYF